VWICASKAYGNERGSGGISHATARSMLNAQPLQSHEAEAFIGCKTGLGLFVTQAGPNRVCMHQAANDGFRGFVSPSICFLLLIFFFPYIFFLFLTQQIFSTKSLISLFIDLIGVCFDIFFAGIFLSCFDGPQRGQGLIVLSNGDRNAVPFNARVSQVFVLIHSLSLFFSVSLCCLHHVLSFFDIEFLICMWFLSFFIFIFLFCFTGNSENVCVARCSKLPFSGDRLQNAIRAAVVTRPLAQTFASQFCGDELQFERTQERNV
jgi:hypothetical protein